MDNELDISAMIDTTRDILITHRNIVNTNAEIIRLFNTLTNRQRIRSSATSPIRTRRVSRRVRLPEEFNTRVDELVQENGMTPEQIDRQTTRGPYSQVREDNTERRCPISWTQLNDDTEVTRINGCGHVFTTASLREWLLLHSTCPTCRFNLIPDEQDSGNGVPEPEGIDLRTATARIFADMLSGSPIESMGNLASIAQRLERNVPNNLN